MRQKQQAGGGQPKYHYGGGSMALSVAEFSRAVGIHEITLRRHIAAGEIVATRLGRRLLIPRSELDRVLGR
jgi:excisionase family DNA binding protein